MATLQLVSQGAEGRLFETTFLGKPCLKKERFKKAYRHPVLDEKLTNKRLTQECRSLSKCRSLGIRTPTVYYVDHKTNTIYMEYMKHTVVLKDFIDEHVARGERTILEDLCYNVGYTIGLLHNGDIIHGDLTTSNILVMKRIDKYDCVMIDFGLSINSSLVEDKGVDLYVLEKAFLSTHPNSQDLFDKILAGYCSVARAQKAVVTKLREVRLRGRKRSMVG
ncbi:EKC/KEOPS complex subunit TP53RK-like [Bolinopsis microptera]|uniref:EKC/KEOPS complex subunit TP53RK-like n=1 Tax=Bolinopsis microptera TaxID=2820187 RepID=UPI00307B001B